MLLLDYKSSAGLTGGGLACIYIYIYLFIYVIKQTNYTYIYIYSEREREREREVGLCSSSSSSFVAVVHSTNYLKPSTINPEFRLDPCMNQTIHTLPNVFEEKLRSLLICAIPKP